ncbi:cd4-specific ankyrin repeat protein [Chrysochromulina tobinii]|uniref:Cd4-specific ankyrin repeat protein n=1 Tax=Chrysochromulina tobinii TaxID=1460289 RepID=A0A0M0K9A0_9EUKA|nr:cd4-specific ankyrin repeat protein [Chrysochromulina tobinii]|eukprot:KOO35384.1 cd4-specific ankyrin repeat protein [Chrysochromulina sp. CCMP291]
MLLDFKGEGGGEIDSIAKGAPVWQIDPNAFRVGGWVQVVTAEGEGGFVPEEFVAWAERDATKEAPPAALLSPQRLKPKSAYLEGLGREERAAVLIASASRGMLGRSESFYRRMELQQEEGLETEEEEPLPLPQAPPGTASDGSAMRVLVALAEYTGQPDSEEVSLTTGMRLLQLEPPDANGWVGVAPITAPVGAVSPRRMAAGFAPATYLTVLEPDGVMLLDFELEGDSELLQIAKGTPVWIGQIDPNAFRVGGWVQVVTADGSESFYRRMELQQEEGLETEEPHDSADVLESGHPTGYEPRSVLEKQRVLFAEHPVHKTGAMSVRYKDFYPSIVLSYASGRRTKRKDAADDCEGSGPGVMYAMGLMEFLHERGLQCFSGLQVPPGVDWQTFMLRLTGENGKREKPKVLIIILTAGLYQSKPCLKEISTAIENKIALLPVRFEDNLPAKEEQWTNLDDPDWEMMKFHVQAKLNKLNNIPNPGTVLTRASALDDVMAEIEKYLPTSDAPVEAPIEARPASAAAAAAEVDAVVGWSTPQLKEFLVQHGVVMGGFVEKRELIDEVQRLKREAIEARPAKHTAQPPTPIPLGGATPSTRFPVGYKIHVEDVEHVSQLRQLPPGQIGKLPKNLSLHDKLILEVPSHVVRVDGVAPAAIAAMSCDEAATWTGLQILHMTREQLMAITEQQEARDAGATKEQMKAAGLLQKATRELFEAAKAGKNDELKTLIDVGGDVCWKNPSEDGMTALHCAALEGHLACVKTLLHAKVRLVDILTSTKGATALHSAAAGGHVNCIEALLRAKVRLDATTSDGDTALHIAARLSKLDAVKRLLAAGARTAIRNKAGQAALDIARWRAKMAEKAETAEKAEGHILGIALHLEAAEKAEDVLGGGSAAASGSAGGSATLKNSGQY